MYGADNGQRDVWCSRLGKQWSTSKRNGSPRVIQWSSCWNESLSLRFHDIFLLYFICHWRVPRSFFNTPTSPLCLFVLSSEERFGWFHLYYPRITHVGPLSPEHSLLDIIGVCIRTLILIDDDGDRCSTFTSTCGVK